MPWFSYCLFSNSVGRTYVGATTSVFRRLKDHNERKCGAKYTKYGRPWTLICYVKGFESKRSALSFEWHWKHKSRRCKGTPLEKRIKALDLLLLEHTSLEKVDVY